jgi:hypothetical protein
MAKSWRFVGSLVAATTLLAAGAGTARAEGPGFKLKGAFGEGVGIESNDGAFGMGLRARVQVRTTVVAPDDGSDASADFQIRRLRLTLEGFGWKKLVSFKIQLAAAALDLDPVAPLIIRDAYANFALHRDLEVRVGQMKVPFGRQRVVSSGNLQMVDRSVVTSELNLDRDVGIQALSTDFLGQHGLLGYNVGVFGGDGRGRVSGGYGFMYVGRLELRALGGKQAAELDEVDFERSRKPRLAFGVSGAFNHLSDRQRSIIGPVYQTGTWVSYAHVGADWAFKWAGLTVTGEFFLRRALQESNTESVQGKSVTDYSRSGYGAFVQAGKLFGPHLEVSARLGAMYPLANDPKAGGPREKELGGAVSYYFAKHALKLQADYFYLFEEWGQGRHQVRVQMQFAP